MKQTLATTLAVLALALTACSGGDESTTAEDPATTESSATPSKGATESPTEDGTYPPFGEEDYTYRLEVLCFCPLRGPVEVTVADGAVADASFVRRGQAGAEVPEFLRLTIDDIIAKANDPKPDKVTVRWPDGQAWPRSVSIDNMTMATDDEVTYLVKDVRVG